jgi:resuscitation-promoting factor RpfB
MFTLLLFISLFSVVAGCSPTPEAPAMLVSLVVDGRELVYEYAVPVTVGEFLRDAEIELGEQDRVNPPEFTQINDGMRVTVVRVREERECEQQEIPYSERTVLFEGLQAGEERLGQAGQNGVQEICYRVYIEDNIRRDPIQISQTILVEPQDEVIYVGPTGELEPVPIIGTLAYISNRNAWIMRDSSTTKRPLTTTGDLDPRIFSLTSDGRKLLFARDTLNDEGNETFFNQLWVLTDTTQDREPIQLIPGDVLYAEWVPGTQNTLSYSTGEGREAAPGWQAFNDLWLMRLDPDTAEALSIDEVIEPSSGGLYGWWGTSYYWSPDGQRLAWVRADSIGLVNLETGELATPLFNYALFRTFQDWSWRSDVSWSPDGNLLAATVHGRPVGSEPAESSPAFHVAIADTEGNFTADIVEGAGIWAAPAYSPILNGDTEFPQGYLAYLRARDPGNSVNGEYDLIVADRDGSNARKIFPDDGQTGLTAQRLAWSPDGRQLAFTYQGNLWIIDVESGVTHQLTLDGGASKPIWTR